MIEDQRIKAMRSWLENELQLQLRSFTPASSDASFRRYFRIKHQYGTHILMDAPPDRENTRSFIAVAELLGQAGIHVPTIYQQDPEQGFLLIEDFGSRCFLDILPLGNENALYHSAMAELLCIQSKIDITDSPLPQYDEHLLRTELGLFEKWFLQALLDQNPAALPHQLLDDTWSLLIRSALEQPRVCVHRDYHSRNLMYRDDKTPGIIDFQDAVIGPITYDLVSLLRDCYICWPEKSVLTWMADYYQCLRKEQFVTCDQQQFQRWFDLMGLQRHLKAVGIFARLHLRDQKPVYLHDIPRTLQYVAAISERYPELSEFNRFIRQLVHHYPFPIQ